MKITKIYFVNEKGNIIPVVKEAKELVFLLKLEHYYITKKEAVKESKMLTIN